MTLVNNTGLEGALDVVVTYQYEKGKQWHSCSTIECVRWNAIREEFSAVTHAQIESLRKLGLHGAETLPKKLGINNVQPKFLRSRKSRCTPEYRRGPGKRKV